MSVQIEALRANSDALLRILRLSAIALLIAAVPILLVTTSLRLAINGLWLYEYGFDKYDIPEATGIAETDLTEAGREVIAYFNSDDEFIDIRTTINGEEQDLFNQREIIHMKDVKGLVRGVYLWQVLSLLYILIFAGLGFALGGRRILAYLAKGLLAGGGLTVFALIALGLGVLLGFDSLFLRFHLTFFSNDFWRSNGYMTALFTEGFFQDATLVVAGLSIGMAVIIGAVAGAFLLWRRRATKSRLGEGQEATSAAPLR
ncbi:MAG: DUF1461 domain-containing protein [Dehalococcoidia bacterium]